MAVLRIAKMGNPVLLQKSAPVEDPTAPEIARLAQDMQDTIEDVGASGLAAGPLHPGVRPAYRDGVFAVGNAAAEAHPVVGEGIAMALGSAALLCERLAPALASADFARRERRVAQSYGHALRRLFALRLWMSARLAALAMLPSASGWAARLVEPAPGLLAIAARLSGK